MISGRQSAQNLVFYFRLADNISRIAEVHCAPMNANALARVRAPCLSQEMRQTAVKLRHGNMHGQDGRS
jgi:hypothetical protein